LQPFFKKIQAWINPTFQSPRSWLNSANCKRFGSLVHADGDFWLAQNLGAAAKLARPMNGGVQNHPTAFFR
jgi:hypothetical protein